MNHNWIKEIDFIYEWNSTQIYPRKSAGMIDPSYDLKNSYPSNNSRIGMNYGNVASTAMANPVQQAFSSEQNEDDDIKTVGIRGEYWFDEDGNIIFADGDIGDVGHEGIVINQMAGMLLSQFDLYSDEPYFDYNSTDEESILNEISDDDDFFIQNFNIPESELDDIDRIEILKEDPADNIIKYLTYSGMDEKEANDIVMIAYGSTRDAREFAINTWNWKRVQGDAIETKQLTSKDLQIIASGINQAINDEGLYYEYEDSPEVLDNHKYEISTYTGKLYNISLKDMEAGNVEGLERGDLEIKKSAATEKLKKMDQEQMPSFYKGQFGDSVDINFDELCQFLI